MDSYDVKGLESYPDWPGAPLPPTGFWGDDIAARYFGILFPILLSSVFIAVTHNSRSPLRCSWRVHIFSELHP